MGKKEILAKAMMKTGLFGLIRRYGKKRLIVFNYHRIRSDDASEKTVFDDEVFGPTASEFEQQVAWISKRFEVNSEQDLIDIAAGRKEIDATQVAFTFDDGYKDNYQLAYPILNKYKVPAIFFVPSGMIDNRNLGWWDRVSYLLTHSTKDEISLRGETFDLKNNEPQAERAIKDKFVSSAFDVYQGLIEELAEVCQVALPASELEDKELMSWDEIKEMAGNGHAIGSHGVSHRVLTTLRSDEVRSELLESKSRIEEVVGNEVKSLAYPVGLEKTFNSGIEQIALEAGYQQAFSFNTGINEKSIEDRFAVRRLYPHSQPEWVAGVTVWPDLFMWQG